MANETNSRQQSANDDLFAHLDRIIHNLDNGVYPINGLPAAEPLSGPVNDLLEQKARMSNG